MNTERVWIQAENRYIAGNVLRLLPAFTLIAGFCWFVVYKVHANPFWTILITIKYLALSVAIFFHSRKMWPRERSTISRSIRLETFELLYDEPWYLREPLVIAIVSVVVIGGVSIATHRWQWLLIGAALWFALTAGSILYHQVYQEWTKQQVKLNRLTAEMY